MKYQALLKEVEGRGRPPRGFLDELVAWGRGAADEIFDVNDEAGDVMGRLREVLGPWEGEAGTKERLLHRKGCLLELLRCLAGFESSWNWAEGVDRTNRSSQAEITGQETGIFQVSYNSIWLEKTHRTLRDLLARKGVKTVGGFIETMKTDHELALEYAARLLRVSYRWDGPILRREIDASLSREAVAEWKVLMAS